MFESYVEHCVHLLWRICEKCFCWCHPFIYLFIHSLFMRLFESLYMTFIQVFPVYDGTSCICSFSKWNSLCFMKQRCFFVEIRIFFSWTTHSRYSIIFKFVLPVLQYSHKKWDSPGSHINIIFCFLYLFEIFIWDSLSFRKVYHFKNSQFWGNTHTFMKWM